MSEERGLIRFVVQLDFETTTFEDAKLFASAYCEGAGVRRRYPLGTLEPMARSVAEELLSTTNLVRHKHDNGTVRYYPQYTEEVVTADDVNKQKFADLEAFLEEQFNLLRDEGLFFPVVPTTHEIRLGVLEKLALLQSRIHYGKEPEAPLHAEIKECIAAIEEMGIALNVGVQNER